MAKIWPVYEGKEPTIGGPWASLLASEAIAIFDLQRDHLVTEPGTTPRFGDIQRDLMYAGFKHIVVEIESGEGRKEKWKPGFYRSPITPKEAFNRLIRHALTAELGENNVVRVEFEPTTDSTGRDALKVTVVIAPGATERLKNGATLDALVSLQERLREMREDRVPIIEYATEAELAQDAGP
jgi:hypothetical protein